MQVSGRPEPLELAGELVRDFSMASTQNFLGRAVALQTLEATLEAKKQSNPF
jgi:hypothetical protein